MLFTDGYAAEPAIAEPVKTFPAVRVDEWPDRIQGDSAWEPADFASEADYTLFLSQDEVAEVRAALLHFNSRFGAHNQGPLSPIPPPPPGLSHRISPIVPTSTRQPANPHLPPSPSLAFHQASTSTGTRSLRPTSRSRHSAPSCGRRRPTCTAGAASPSSAA